MAPLPDIEDTYRCALKWNVGNMVNVLHIHKSGSTPAAIGSLIASHVSSAMWQTNNSNHKILTIDITPLFAASATYTYTTDATAKWGGTKAGEPIFNCAAVVSLHTVFRGPANRGRVYVGPLDESASTQSQISTSDRSAMVTAWGAFGSGLVGDSAQHVVASYKHTTAITVVNYSVRATPGTVRRRMERLNA